MWAVARAHCHYASQDPDLVAELFRTVQTGLDHHDYDEIRPFLCLFEVLLETTHVNFVGKRREWLDRFMEVVENNVAYYKWMETVLEFIFKIVSKQPPVRDWFYANQAKWRCLTEWARHHRPPHPAQTGANGARLLKARQNYDATMMSALHQYNEVSPARSALNATYRRRRLHSMLSQEVPDLSDEVDPDRGDLQDYKFLPGDTVVLLDRKRDEAEKWRVVAVFDEMISLQSQEPDAARCATRWQKCDTDKLVLEEVYQQLARARIRRELLEPRTAPRTGGARARGANAARVGPESQDPEQAWQGTQGTGQGAPQEGTGDPSEASSDAEGYGESDDDGHDLYS